MSKIWLGNLHEIKHKVYTKGSLVGQHKPTISCARCYALTELSKANLERNN